MRDFDWCLKGQVDKKDWNQSHFSSATAHDYRFVFSIILSSNAQ
jgi:hypothetical protein